jgi:hypothetical protein
MRADRELQPNDPSGGAGEQSSRLQEALLLVREKLRAVLGPEKANELLPPNIQVKGIEVEQYRSSTFLDANFAGFPEVHGRYDGAITTIGTADHRQIFIVEERVTSDKNEILPGSFLGGVDNRELVTSVHNRAEGIIEEYTADGVTYAYQGESGDPDWFLAQTRSRLGTLHDGKTFGERQHYWDDPRPS